MAIYLDNAATSYPKPETVYTSMDTFLRQNGASAGRGNYARAREAGELVYQVRKSVARLLGAKRPSNIVFTANATDSLNIILKGFLQSGDTVLTSCIEHNSMRRPLHTLVRDRGVKLLTFGCTPDGEVNWEEVTRLLDQNVKLVAMVHGSNVLGSILPVEKIIDLAHARGIPVLLDAAQTAGTVPFNVTALDADFVAFTGHKGLLGPTGTGGFYIKEGLSLQTLKEGGTGSLSKSPLQPDTLPDRYEAGTLNTVGLVGLTAGVDFLLHEGVDNVRAHETDLITRLLEGLSALDGITIYGTRDPQKRLGLVCFNVDRQTPESVAQFLDEQANIMVRAGLHCCPGGHEILSTYETGAVRASVGYLNTMQDVDSLLTALTDFITTQRR